MSFADWVDTISKIVSTAAIVVGGTWAYYKFVRGRTFAKRAELEVTGHVLDADDLRAIRAHVELRNTGAAKIPLRAKGVWVYGLNSDSAAARAGWGDHLAAVKVLTHHDWLEAQETISDDVLIPLPDELAEIDSRLAYRLEFRVYELRKGAKGGIQWTAEAIVPARLAPVASAAEAGTERKTQNA